MRIETDVPLKVVPDDFAWPGVDEKLAAELLRELEFNSILPRILAGAGGPSRPRSHAKPAATSVETISPTRSSHLADAPRIAVDLSTLGDPARRRLQLSEQRSDDRRRADSIASAASSAELATPLKSCHDLKNQIEAFARHGIALDGVDFDTMLAGFLVNPGQAEPSLTHLYHEHLAPLGASSPPGTNAT